jgi:hypothetical protein
MLADCCMLPRQEWGFMAVVGWWRPPWLIDARNHNEQKTSPPAPIPPRDASCHHDVPNRSTRKEVTNSACRGPRQRLGSWPPWPGDACLLANLTSKNTLTTTQKCLSTRCDLNGQQRQPWCPTPGSTAHNSKPACWMIFVCGDARRGAPWQPWDKGGHHGRWDTVWLALAACTQQDLIFLTDDTSSIGPIDGARSIISLHLSGFKQWSLKYSFPTPWNTRHYPYLGGRW